MGRAVVVAGGSPGSRLGMASGDGLAAVRSAGRANRCGGRAGRRVGRGVRPPLDGSPAGGGRLAAACLHDSAGLSRGRGRSLPCPAGRPAGLEMAGRLGQSRCRLVPEVRAFFCITVAGTSLVRVAAHRAGLADRRRLGDLGRGRVDRGQSTQPGLALEPPIAFPDFVSGDPPVGRTVDGRRLRRVPGLSQRAVDSCVSCHPADDLCRVDLGQDESGGNQCGRGMGDDADGRRDDGPAGGISGPNWRVNGTCSRKTPPACRERSSYPWPLFFCWAVRGG